jgi:hypothetical protein
MQHKSDQGRNKTSVTTNKTYKHAPSLSLSLSLSFSICLSLSLDLKCSKAE